MPGIPRSKGCQKCVQRRVKCDETRPTCRECARRNFICPGYPEKFTFYNVHTWNSQQAHRSNRGVRIYGSGGSDIVRTSIDTQVMPSLATHATHTQECAIFSRYVGANSSGQWACYAHRMDLNWLDFILHPTQPHPPFLLSAVHALSILHLSQTENPNLVTQSMYAYGDTLASLRRGASCLPLSDGILAAAILVVLYEMKNMSFQASWVTTMNSIANVMQCTRNPSATYASGFGRTLFLTIRPFLIRAALSCGQACFLERVEWISVVQMMVRSENCSGREAPSGRRTKMHLWRL
ncbi:hypothetical protein BJX63DRAFT_180392 [Aspergillus granulosus]|uniref:Zn(2)-C6 fungal-type domain-containing protein n=1 Tax=Aspergillus granulosus TaxID=176169 RepID=A0ABR4I2P3_9EURO